MNDLLSDDNSQPSIDPDKDYYSELVGEGKKYKDNKAFARSRVEADFHIKKIEQENEELRTMALKLREENIAKATFEDLIDRASKTKQQTETVTTQTEVKEKPFDPEQVKSLVSEEYQRLEFSRKQDANFKIVEDKLKERFGTNYKTILREQIDELGLTAEDINALARKSPNAFFKTMGLDQQSNQEQFQTPPRSQRISDNFKPNTQKRTWSYYKNLKKDNPSLYQNPKTQVQMQRDYVELGEAFEDGDFKAYGQ